MDGAALVGGTARIWRRARSALLRADDARPRMTRRSWTFDVVVMAGTLVYGLSQVGRYTAPDVVGRRVPPLVGRMPLPVHVEGAVSHALVATLVLLSTLPLAWRRRYPLAMFMTVMAAGLLYHAHGGVEPTFAGVPGLIAAYSALLYSPYRIMAAALVTATAVTAMLKGFAELSPVADTLLPTILIVPVGLAFNTINTWKQRAEASREKLRAVEAEQQAATRVAVEQERARLASELHDIVTHNVSVMVIQAGAARMVLDADPEQAREALLAVEAGGRAAMAELRHVMGLLTTSGGAAGDAAGVDVHGQAEPTAAELAPAPGLAQVPALVERVRATGVPVALTVAGEPVALSAGADLAAYRVVQEALTNTVKHAEGASVLVTIMYASAAVTVDVADTGGVPGEAARTGSGRGLAGLRERLAVYDGTLHAERRPTGGFRTRAVIPAEPVLSASLDRVLRALSEEGQGRR